MNKLGMAAAFALALSIAGGGDADAFCGFYVGGADAKLFNNATQVVMMREGQRTVLSMQNDYQGPPEGFALVVPVPVILQKENVKTLPKDVFDRIDKLTAPRLVEYWEQDPCPPPAPDYGPMGGAPAPQAAPAMVRAEGKAMDLGVTVEAKFSVGEYEIVILSAKDAGGLDTWLKQQKYKIPEGAEPYLKPYVQSGSKFFVAKVDPKKVTMVDGHAALSPLRFHYDSSEFALPVRLGLINSNGTQDLIVNILAQNQRFEPANYPTVTIPTNLDVGEDAKSTFGGFYASLFDETLAKNKNAIVTEYSWDASTCDPCPGPAMNQQDFVTLGADAIPNNSPPQATVTVATGAPLNVIQAAPFQWFARACWQTTLQQKPKTKGGRVETKITPKKDGGVTAAITKNETGDNDLAACLKKGAEGLRGINAEVTIPLNLGSAVPPRLHGWTVTRLHARYNKDALGQDIVFKTAGPIMGGREVRRGGPMSDLEHGSTPASGSNNFQGRYAIRHPWTGPIACANPQRGIWGGPPAGHGNSMPVAAEKIAFAPRGTKLVSFLRSDVPELGITGVAKPLLQVATPPPAPAASPAPPDAALPGPPLQTPPPAGCGCVIAGQDGNGTWLALGSLAAVAIALIRARRR